MSSGVVDGCEDEYGFVLSSGECVGDEEGDSVGPVDGEGEGNGLGLGAGRPAPLTRAA